MNDSIVNCKCGAKYKHQENRYCQACLTDARTEYLQRITKEIRKARDILPRYEYNKMMNELQSISRVQSDLSNTEKTWDIAKSIFDNYKIKD